MEDERVSLHLSELIFGPSEGLAPPQGRLLFQRLLGLDSHRVKLKIASSRSHCAELKALAAHGEPVCHIFNL